MEAEESTSYWISLMSTVLSLRGGHVTAQPFVDASSNSALCWNGEAWKIGLDTVSGNDGQAVFDLLIKASADHVSASDSTAAVLHALRSISGPFAFVYLDTYHNQLYFGRDRLGRRSLLYKSDEDAELQLSSISDATSGSWLEVEVDAVCRLPLDGIIPSPEQHDKSTHELLHTDPAIIHRHMWDSEDEPYPVSTLVILEQHQQEVRRKVLMVLSRMFLLVSLTEPFLLKSL